LSGMQIGDYTCQRVKSQHALQTGLTATERNPLAHT
jgi:hypothetical protein